MCLIKEVWKDIPDYPNYQVSNYGRVKSLERVVIYKDGRKYTYSERILKQGKCKNGYLLVSLSKDSKMKSFTVHKIVALAFIKNNNPTEKTQINHLDENKENNHVDNLKWVTPKENCNYGTHNERISKANKCKEKSEEHKQKISKAHKGKHHTKETRKKMCEQRKGKPQYKHRKPIIQCTLDGVFVKEWYGVTEVEKELGLSHKNISQHLKGKTKSAYGFFWKYKE